MGESILELPPQSHSECRWKTKVSPGEIQELEKGLRVLGINHRGDKNGMWAARQLSGDHHSSFLHAFPLETFLPRHILCWKNDER